MNDKDSIPVIVVHGNSPDGFSSSAGRTPAQQQPQPPRNRKAPKGERKIRESAVLAADGREKENKSIRIFPKYSKQERSKRSNNSGGSSHDDTDDAAAPNGTHRLAPGRDSVEGMAGMIATGFPPRTGIPVSYSCVSRVGNGDRREGIVSIKRPRSEGERLEGGEKKHLLVSIDERERRRTLYSSSTTACRDDDRSRKPPLGGGGRTGRRSAGPEVESNGLKRGNYRCGLENDENDLRRILGSKSPQSDPAIGPGQIRESSSKVPLQEEAVLGTSAPETDVKVVEEVEEDVPDPSKADKLKNCCKRFLAFLFSTIGLSFLLVGYTTLGGVIFRSLEAPNEVRTKNDMVHSRRYYVSLLWNVTEELNVLYPENWTLTAEAILKDFTDEVFHATKVKGWDGNDDAEKEQQWSFPGALLYSVTVITTIGYGHIAPKTPWGQVVTMLYAIIGIPLTLLTITNLGGFMATAFRFIYKNLCWILYRLCCCVCCYPRRRPSRPRSGQSDVQTESSQTQTGQGAALISPNRNSKTSSSSTRRRAYSGSVAQQTATKVTARSQSQPAASKTKTAAGAGPGRPTTPVPPRRKSLLEHSSSGLMSQEYPEYDVEVTWRSGLSRSLTQADGKETVSVPIYVSLLLISGYIALGAMVFSVWEEDWDYLVGSYFCFITLSTIGFGDYVPGTSVDASKSQEKLIFCTLYLVFGLALLAMCFDLMQEETRRKFRSLGRMLGLLDKIGT